MTSTVPSSPRTRDRVQGRPDGLRTTASLFTAAVAFSAYAGAVGLVGGGITFGGGIDERLPFDSHVLAGVALLLFVAVPMTLASVAVWRRTAHAVDLLEGAGVVLVLWIAVELAFIKAYSWFHPAYLMVAVLVIGMAMAERALTTRPTANQPGGPKTGA